MPRTSLDAALAAFARIAPRLASGERTTLEKLPHAGVREDIPWGEETVPVYIHRAKTCNAPCVFELHGGGFALGTALRDDALCEAFCRASGACVVGIDYPLAPTRRYPAALDAAAAVIRHFAANAREYGLDARRFGVLGLSAGANLAAGLAAERRQRGLPLAAQLLYYPYLDLLTPEEDKAQFPLDMPADQMRVFRSLYCTQDEWALAAVSPALATAEFAADAPQAFVCLAERDTLYAEGKRYAALLEAAGAGVTVREEPGMHHGFIEDAYMPSEAVLRLDEDRTLFPPDFRQRAAEALAAGADFLRGV